MAAAVFAAGAITALALAPRGGTGVPAVGEVRGDVALTFAFAFPEGGDAPLERPVGVATAGDRVYVVDSVAGVVRVYDDRGVERSVVGSGTLDVPVYAAADEARGVLYVTDRSTRLLSVFSLEDDSFIGTLTPSVPEESEVSTAWAPLALDVTESGELVVSDVLARHRVLVLDPEGTVLTEIGGTSAASGETTGVAAALDFPNGVSVAGEEIWVTDSNNKRTLVFGLDGAFSRVVAASGLARGLDFVPPIDDTVESTLAAIADTLGSEIVLADLTGAVQGTFGGAGTAEGQLAFPNDIAVDAERARVYVADTGNRRVQAWEIVKAERGGLGGLIAAGADRYRIVALFLGILALGSATLVYLLRPRPAGMQDAPPEGGVKSE